MTNPKEIEEKSFKHWATVVSEEAIERFGKKQVIATGWAASGYYHIGNFKEAVSSRAIQKELTRLGADCYYLLNIDDLDPFDKIPGFFKKDYGKLLKPYLGHPLNEVPDPLDCHDSYAEHFTEDAIAILDVFDVQLDPIKTSDLYKQGKYHKYAKLFLDKKEEMFELTKEITGTGMEELLLVQCPKCKNIDASKILNYRYEGEKIIVEMLCGREKRGCGETSTLTLGDTSWKLKWRLDWAARQDFLGVTVESSGKDHGSAGGSIDSSLAIHNRIFEKEKLPMLITHGFLTFGGKKLSGSTGSGTPVSKFPSILDPSVFLYKIYRNNLNTDFDFRVEMDVPSVAAEFDTAEALFFQESDIEHKKTKEKTVKAYELALFGDPPAKKPLRVDYGQLVTYLQVYLFDEEKVIDMLKAKEIIPYNISKVDLEFLKNRMKRVRCWIKDYASDNFKFTVNEKPDCGIINTLEPSIIDLLYQAIEEVPDDYLSDQITQYLYESAKSRNLKPAQFFRTLYQIVLGKSSGPRAGTIIEVIGKEKVLHLIKLAQNC